MKLDEMWPERRYVTHSATTRRSTAAPIRSSRSVPPRTAPWPPCRRRPATGQRGRRTASPTPTTRARATSRSMPTSCTPSTAGRMINLIDTRLPRLHRRRAGCTERRRERRRGHQRGHGIEVNTRRMFHEAASRLARMIVLNKLDADNVNFEQLLTTVRATFGTSACCSTLRCLGPNLRASSASSNPPSPPPPTARSISGRPAPNSSRRSSNAMSADGALLGEGDLINDELNAGAAQGDLGGCLVPILCTRPEGPRVPELLDGSRATRWTPRNPPQRRRERPSGRGPDRPREDGEFVGQVFKTVNDKFVGHLSYVRVLSGKAEGPRHHLRPADRQVVPSGRDPDDARQAAGADRRGGAGRHSGRGQGGRPGDRRPRSAPRRRCPSCRRRATPSRCSAWPSSRRPAATSRRFPSACTKIADEDPTFKLTRDPQTKELVVTGVSQLHLDVILQRPQAAIRPRDHHPRAEGAVP